MPRDRSSGLWIAVLLLCSTTGAADGPIGADPVDYLVDSLREFPIVCLSEGGHATAEPHQVEEKAEESVETPAS